jgi:hypothetical protein
MLRRFSINFALLSMLFDMAAVALGLWGAGALRPFLNRIDPFHRIPDYLAADIFCAGDL